MKKQLIEIGRVACHPGKNAPQGFVTLYYEKLVDTAKNLSYIEKRKKAVAQ